MHTHLHNFSLARTLVLRLSSDYYISSGILGTSSQMYMLPVVSDEIMSLELPVAGRFGRFCVCKRIALASVLLSLLYGVGCVERHGVFTSLLTSCQLAFPEQEGGPQSQRLLPHAAPQVLAPSPRFKLLTGSRAAPGFLCISGVAGSNPELIMGFLCRTWSSLHRLLRVPGILHVSPSWSG